MNRRKFLFQISTTVSTLAFANIAVYAVGSAFKNIDGLVESPFVGHMLRATILGTAFKALVSNPDIILRNQILFKVRSSPENVLVGFPLKPDHYIREGPGSPQRIPPRIQIQLAIHCPEVIRARGNYGPCPGSQRGAIRRFDRLGRCADLGAKGRLRWCADF